MARADAEMTRIVRRTCYLMMLAAVAALTGCGNASQHLSMGPWEEVGQAESPIAGEQSSFEVTTLVPGDGPVVRPGDLVKAKVTVTTVDNQGRTRDPSPPHVIWVWTGRTPQPVTGQDVSTYGTLGGAQPRATLINRHLHEQFQIALREGASNVIGAFPVRGFIDSQWTRLRTSAPLHGMYVGPLKWLDVNLRSFGGLEKTPSARIEILEICPGAKLYRRTATLTQDGIVITTGDINYPRHRQGILGWSALEAQCPAPEGHVRFQAGPFHDSDLSSPTMLMDWSDSYAELRPPDQHPEEWQSP
jgi:hypothetical protein